MVLRDRVAQFLDLRAHAIGRGCSPEGAFGDHRLLEQVGTAEAAGQSTAGPGDAGLGANAAVRDDAWEPVLLAGGGEAVEALRASV